MSYTKITSVEMLKKICTEEWQDFFINLRGFRSSKNIYYHKDRKLFFILNNIDDTEQNLTEAELFTHSNIGDAINAGNFYKY